MGTVRERDKGNGVGGGMEDICCQVAPGIIKSVSLFCFMATLCLPSGAITRQECKKEQLKKQVQRKREKWQDTYKKIPSQGKVEWKIYAEKFFEIKFIFQLTFLPYLLVVLPIYAKSSNITRRTIERCGKTGVGRLQEGRVLCYTQQDLSCYRSYSCKNMFTFDCFNSLTRRAKSQSIIVVQGKYLYQYSMETEEIWYSDSTLKVIGLI